MKKLFYAAFASMIVGVLSGLFYREYTKALDFEGDSQLGLVHTHFLVLGFIAFLIFLALDKLFGVSKSPLFSWFFWSYSVGLLLTGGMMIAQGIVVVGGGERLAAFAGIAGIGHTLLAIALVLYFLALRPLVAAAVTAAPAKAAQPVAEAPVTGR